MMCRICDGIDPEISNVANAEKLGVSETTIRRHKSARHVESVDPFFDVPLESISSRGASIRTAYGWEKITFNVRQSLAADALTYDDVERLLLAAPTPRVPKQAARETFVLSLADAQAGKTDLGGGTEELIERFKVTTAAHLERLRDRPVSEILLIDAGDVIENFYNTSSQAQTNDINLTTQVRTARGLMADALIQAAPLAPRVTFVSVPSNHASVRVARKSPASIPHDDFGIDINYSLEERFGAHPGYQHLSFVRPHPLMEAVVHETADGTYVGVVHGHQKNSPFQLGDWWKGQSHGRRNDFDKADILVAGHFHSFTTYASGDDRRVFISPSIDNGSSWYGNLTGESSKPAMMSLFVSDGQWSDVAVY